MNELLGGFIAGNAAILTNACLLPLYPGLIAFLAGSADEEQSRLTTGTLGVLVLAGILSMMLLIGFVLSLLSVSFGAVLPVLLPIVYLIVIALGVVMLLGRNPFATLQTAQAPMLRNRYLTAYVYGLLFGPMTLPCTGPIIISAFLVGSGFGDVAQGIAYFLAFGLGFGWPLVVLPLIALPVQRQIVGWLSRHHEALTRGAGFLLVAVGVFGILTELVPQVAPDFHFDTPLQLLYWVLALGMSFGIGAWTIHGARRKNDEIAAV